MKIAYFDCYAGISGDMTLGALVDAGFPLPKLKEELKKIKVLGYKISKKNVIRQGIHGTQILIKVADHQPHRSCRDILNLIDKSRLAPDVKKLSAKIFDSLAEVEARIHRIKKDHVHFHEIGAIDSIMDVVGAAICLKGLKIEKVFSSVIPVGSGFIRCAHGLLPVPAPATVALLKKVPIVTGEAQEEMTTPTGAAIIKEIGCQFGEMPSMEIGNIGYGAGSKTYNFPNYLRVFLGKLEEKKEAAQVFVIETNIDDMNPEIYDYVFERLFARGALDVYLTPIYMKKNRPAVLLNVVLESHKVDAILEILFSETSTLGVRIKEMTRRTLKREIKRVETIYGEVFVKVGFWQGRLKNVAPEFESCKKLAKRKGVPIKEIYDAAKGEIFKHPLLLKKSRP